MDFTVLSEISNRLSYFSVATDILQADSRLTISKVIPVMIFLEEALLYLQPSCNRQPSSQPAECLRSALLTSLYNRFEQILTSQVFITATILDPSIKLSFCNALRPIDRVFLFLSDDCKRNAIQFLKINCSGADSSRVSLSNIAGADLTSHVFESATFSQSSTSLNLLCSSTTTSCSTSNSTSDSQQ